MNINGKNMPRSPWLSHELMLLKTKKETTAYLYIILTLFTVSIFGFFILRPAFATITNLQKKLADSNAVYNALQEKLDALKQLDGEYSQIKLELPLVFSAIPTSSEIPTLTRQIQTLAQNNSILLKSFNVSPVQYYPLESGGKIYGYVFALEVSGSEENVNKFMVNITNFNRIISIERITTGKTSKGNLDLSFSGKAYFQEE